MMVNGVWRPNITCPRCRFRHPAELHCAEAERIAQEGKPEVVECELCGGPTAMTATKRCDGCWELERRIRMQPELARRILDDYDNLS